MVCASSRYVATCGRIGRGGDGVSLQCGECGGSNVAVTFVAAGLHLEGILGAHGEAGEVDRIG